MFIDLLDSLFLHLGIATVRSLIRCLYVDNNDVILLEGLDCGRSLTLIIRIDKTGGARNIDQVKADQLCQTPDEINRSDCSTLDSKALLESFHLGFFALSPKPDRADLIFPQVSSYFVDIVISEKLL